MQWVRPGRTKWKEAVAVSSAAAVDGCAPPGFAFGRVDDDANGALPDDANDIASHRNTSDSARSQTGELAFAERALREHLADLFVVELRRVDLVDTHDNIARL